MRRAHTAWRELLRLFVIVGILFVSLLITVHASKGLAQDTDAGSGLEEQLIATLAPSSTDESKIREVSSSLGFSLAYNSGIFTAQGQVTDASSTSAVVSGMTYTDDELLERRDYSIVKFFPIDNTQKEFSTYPVEMTVLTNIRKNYWDNRVNLPEYRGKDKLDIFIAETTKSQQTSGFTQVGEPAEITVNGTTYKHVSYEYEKTAYDLTYKTTSRFYFTVQNDRPYYISFTNIKDVYDETIPEYESIIKTITYGDLDATKLARQKSKQNHVSLAVDELPADTGYTPQKLGSDNLLNIVAKNQIAVVRVGMIYCADMKLKSAGTVTPIELRDVCAAGIGSGSIITEGGHVATNGHVVRLNVQDSINAHIGMSPTIEEMVKRITPVMDYLIARRDLTPAQVQPFYTALRAKQPDAIRVALNIGVYLSTDDMQDVNETYSYVVQTSNEPIRLSKEAGKPAFIYTGTNIAASYVADNYDNFSSDKGVDFTAMRKSDVAILKMEGAFPVVSLGTILNIKPADRLTAIGYPAFVDDGLMTEKTQTVPSITQGKVELIDEQPGNPEYKLIITSVPIAAGNSGGPSFDDAGIQVGLNTYGSQPCSDGKCFGNGIIRDVDDLSQLAAVQGVNVTAGGKITSEWDNGIQALKSSDYVVAAKSFNKVSNSYNNHYLAVAMRTLAEDRAGEPINYSETSAGTIIFIVVGGVLSLAIIGGVVLVVIKKKRSQVALQSSTGAPTNRQGGLAASSINNPMVPSAPQPMMQPANPQPVTTMQSTPPTNMSQAAPIPTASQIAQPQAVPANPSFMSQQPLQIPTVPMPTQVPIASSPVQPIFVAAPEAPEPPTSEVTPNVSAIEQSPLHITLHEPTVIQPTNTNNNVPNQQ